MVVAMHLAVHGQGLFVAKPGAPVVSNGLACEAQVVETASGVGVVLAELLASQLKSLYGGGNGLMSFALSVKAKECLVQLNDAL
jgi:hypothetical protein